MSGLVIGSLCSGYSGLDMGVQFAIGGHPCQPFSHAGNRKGSDDPRHLWPDVARAIGCLRPRLVVLENVRGHVSLGLDAVIGDLSRLGYDTRWGVVRASDAGAPHGRARCWRRRARRTRTERAHTGTAAWTCGHRCRRNAQLKALGNGVVPQQAALALRMLLGDAATAGAEDLRYLPTPTAGDAKSARNSTATRHRIPPTGIHAGDTLTDILVPRADGAA